MKNFALGLLLGVILGGAAVWYFAADETNPRAKALQEQVDTAGDRAKELARSAAGELKSKFDAFELDPQSIQQELQQTGKVVRRTAKQIGQQVRDTAADSRITMEIKAKLAVDSELSAWDISVSTTNGEVTLSGQVDSPERIGKAMLLALETKGVDRVISTLQVEG